MFAMQNMAKRQKFFNKTKKKGLSPVVATVALVMITVAAAFFISGFVVPFVKNQLSSGTECVGYEEYFTFYEEFEFNCYKSVGGRVLTGLSIQAKSASDEKVENIKGIRIQFLREGESIGVDIVAGAPANSGNLRMLNKSVGVLSVPERGGVKTYVYNSSASFDSVELYPILKNGRICGLTDKMKIDGICDFSVDLEVV